MHPASSQSQSSAQPVAGWPPGGYAAQSSQPPQGPVVKRARVTMIVLISILTELVLIAAGANQWVSDYVVRHTSATSNRFIVHAAYAGLTYHWRFNEKGGDVGRLLLGQLALIGTVLVLTALLVFAVSRGTVTFGRVFFGTWMSVIVATQLGAIVRGFVVDPGYFGASGSRLNFAFFGQLAPTASSFLGSVGLGVLVALLAGLVAVISRRPAGVVVPSEPPPVAPIPAPPAEYRTERDQRTEGDQRTGGDQPTQAFAPIEESDARGREPHAPPHDQPQPAEDPGATQAYRQEEPAAADESQSAQSQSTRDNAERTTQFPPAGPRADEAGTERTTELPPVHDPHRTE
ncbi:MAG: hypothetical protein M3070_12720 [Actinomycetota bacterium]|nr:hypothetical protein [Actinomycetota bacterium]